MEVYSLQWRPLIMAKARATIHKITHFYAELKKMALTVDMSEKHSMVEWSFQVTVQEAKKESS